MRRTIRLNYYWQRGVAAVEFALLAPLFFAFLFGIIEMARVLYLMNAATEATRLGARVAVVCDKIDYNPATYTAIVSRMQDILPGLAATGDVNIEYGPAGCTQANCQTVSVSIIPGAFTINTFIPFLPFTVDLPAFKSTLPRESLSSTGYGNNVLCN